MSSKKNIMMLRVFIAKIQKVLSFFTHKGLDYIKDEKTMVPNDVKEGHFAVFAIKGEEIKRFVVELSYLSNPAFVKLLELAEEEYGFKHNGALAVPCRPEELHRILSVSCCNVMVSKKMK